MNRIGLKTKKEKLSPFYLFPLLWQRKKKTATQTTPSCNGSSSPEQERTLRNKSLTFLYFPCINCFKASSSHVLGSTFLLFFYLANQNVCAMIRVTKKEEGIDTCLSSFVE
jgi:hypothetical protein